MINLLRHFTVAVLLFILLPVLSLQARQAELLHYWNFNDAEIPLNATFTLGGASIEVVLADESELLFDTGQHFTGANARLGDEPGAHLRLNNPLGSVLTIPVPTTGQENIVVKYETRRSGQGAGEQIISYTVDGENYTFFAVVIPLVGPSVVQTLDFSAIPEVNNNPGFAFRIEFATGEGGEAGNNRFDNITVESFEELPDLSLVHYWNFNDVDGLTIPSYTRGGGDLEIRLATETEVLAGTLQDFYGANARFGDEPETHLRLNNPLGAVLIFTIPTTGFRSIRMNYETRRSGQGAGIQEVSYTTDGQNFEPFSTLTVFDDVPVNYELDFSGIPEADDNPDFAVMITFEQGEGGISGNNRFDNVTLDGASLGETNLPPAVVHPVDLLQLVAMSDEAVIDLLEVFTDPEDDLMSFSAVGTRESVADISLDGNLLTIIPQLQGGTNITVSADDGTNPAVSTSFRVLVYPEAHSLISDNGDGGEAGNVNGISHGNGNITDDGNGIDLVMQSFSFSEWSPDEPDGAFPPNMLFIQSDMDDPGLDDPLLFAYDIPVTDYHDDDLQFLGFPYKLMRRTRMNGLGEGGVAFINTGRGRDLGSAVVALNTENAHRVVIRWTGGTVVPNSRVYHIRLQYRSGFGGDFTDLLSEGGPVEYVRNETGGHSIDFPSVELPEELLGQPYIQLQWKYYFTGEQLSEESGARDQLRISDILIEATPPVGIEDEPSLANRFTLDQNYPNPFNPSTSIRFEIPEADAVSLRVYSILGQEVAILADGMHRAGQHIVNFDASSLSSGLYIYELVTGNRRKTRKMMLVK